MDKTNEITKQVVEAQKTVQQWWSDPLVIKILIGVGIFMVIRFLVFLINYYLGRRIRDTQSRYRFRRVNAFIGYLVILFFLGIVFKDRLAGLSLALGVTGAGIAFALQEVIVSVAGYVAINTGDFYTVGHRIQLGGIKGDVIDIGILRTTLMEVGEWIKSDLYTGRIVRVANSFVFKEPVFNYSGDFPFLWDELAVPIKYGSDYLLARQIIEKVIGQIIGDYTDFAKKSWKDIVRKYYVEEAMIDPVVTMAFNDNWIEFTVRYITDYKLRRATKNRIFGEILAEIQQSGGRVQIGSTTVQLVDPQPFSVRLRGEAEKTT